MINPLDCRIEERNEREIMMKDQERWWRYDQEI